MSEPKFKVGDKVALTHRYGPPTGPYTVRRLHARTGNVMLEGRDGQFDGRSGWMKSSDRWPSGDHIEIWSAAHEGAIERAALLDTLQKFRFHELPTEALRHIAGVAKANLPSKVQS